MNGINIKESKNFFNSTLEDVKQVSIQCSALVTQFGTIEWGPYMTYDKKDEAEGIIGRYQPLLQEMRQIIEGSKASFENLCSRFKNKQIKADDFNWELIEITQKLMTHVEYLSMYGLSELSRAYDLKAVSHQPVVQPIANVSLDIPEPPSLSGDAQ